MKNRIRRSVLDHFPVAAIVLLTISFIFFACLLAYFDSYEEFYEFTREYESWELDEIVMAFFMVLAFFAPVSLLLAHKVFTRNIALQESRNSIRVELEHKRFMEKTRHDMISRLSDEFKGRLREALSEQDIPTLLEAGELEGVIDEIVAVCELGSDYSREKHENIDFIGIVEEGQAALRRNAHKMDANVYFEIDEHFPRKLYGDKYVTGQLVTELLHDAVMRSRFGTVNLKFRHGSAGKRRKRIHIEVRNLGDVVDAHLQRLCADNPSISYLRTHRTFDPDNHFLMAYWLTHMLDGTINVRSQPGGSIITVSFVVWTEQTP